MPSRYCPLPQDGEGPPPRYSVAEPHQQHRDVVARAVVESLAHERACGGLEIIAVNAGSREDDGLCL